MNTSEVRPLLKLAIPLILTGLIESASPFFVTIFLAQLGPEELAAGALVRGLFFTLMVILWGLLTAVSVLVAQKHGEKNDVAVAQILRDSTILSIILTPPAFLLLWYIAPIFILFGQDQAVVSLAQPYLHALAWGILPDFLTLVLLQFIIGLGHTRTSMVFMILWVPIAIFFNYVLIFGSLGFPQLGIAGIGWGLTISYWITVIFLILYMALSKAYKPYMLAALFSTPKRYMNELIQIGLPMGSMYCLEIGFFFALTLMMGIIGDIQLAATQIVLQYLNTLTSVVFSLASAVTVQMGHKLGGKDVVGAHNTSHAGVFISLSFMLVVAICYWLLPEWLIAVDLNVSDPKNAELVRYTKQFLLICALFQICEAVRISLFGSLRALKDTSFTLLASVFGFWLVALPLGYFLSRSGFDGAGLWWGMAIGAGCSAALLHWRFNKKIQHYHGIANFAK
jgi:multidrug resistance protein, MATE family